jgi:excisionase family DNA binding protein
MPVEIVREQLPDYILERLRKRGGRIIAPPQTQSQLEGMLTPKQFGERLGLSRSTLYRLLESGRVRTFRHGRVIRIPASELTRLVN